MGSGGNTTRLLGLSGPRLSGPRDYGPRLTKQQKKARRVSAVTRWQDENSERRRVAFMQAAAQRRIEYEALARIGLYPLPLQSLDDALYELNPPCL